MALKERRHAMLSQMPGYTAVIARLEEPGRLADLFAEHELELDVHLAAPAGVRYSIDHPASCVQPRRKRARGLPLLPAPPAGSILAWAG